VGLLPLGSCEAKGKQVDDEPTHRPVTQTSESSQTEQPLVLNTYRTPPTRPPVVRLGNEPLKVIYSNWVVDGVETAVEPGPEVEWARSSVRGEFKLVIGTEVPTVRLTLRSFKKLGAGLVPQDSPSVESCTSTSKRCRVEGTAKRMTRLGITPQPDVVAIVLDAI